MTIVYSVIECAPKHGGPLGKIRTEIQLDNGNVEAFESEWYTLDWCQKIVDILNKVQK